MPTTQEKIAVFTSADIDAYKNGEVVHPQKRRIIDAILFSTHGILTEEEMQDLCPSADEANAWCAEYISDDRKAGTPRWNAIHALASIPYPNDALDTLRWEIRKFGFLPLASKSRITTDANCKQRHQNEGYTRNREELTAWVDSLVSEGWQCVSCEREGVLGYMLATFLPLNRDFTNTGSIILHLGKAS